MQFNSLTFAVFFALVVATHALLRNWGAQKTALLIASYIFYAAWNPPFVVLLFLLTAFDWHIGRRMGRLPDGRARRALLVFSVCANLGLLAFFKYGDFLLHNFRVAALLLGVDYRPPAADIVLPVGISFFTFQSMSYTLDVYRRRVASDWSFRDYALFVSFFPQLVAGPIVRAAYFLPQLQAPRRATGTQFGRGVMLLVFGLFQKTVLADALLAPVADRVFSAPQQYGAPDCWTAVFAFSGQIFYDFSGYSLCAIGAALCLGFSLPDNFRYPYAALGFADFWHRWHISLSTWLRDYLYVSLGGNRGGTWRTYRNLMLTMLIGGLWHGASWMFVLWGGLHGLYLAVERACRDRKFALPPHGIDLPARLVTFLIISLTWIPFRSPSPRHALEIVNGLYRTQASLALPVGDWLPALLVMTATVLWQLHFRDSSTEAAIGRLGWATQAALVASCLIAIFLWSAGNQRAFIYFQF